MKLQCFYRSYEGETFEEIVDQMRQMVKEEFDKEFETVEDYMKYEAGGFQEAEGVIVPTETPEKFVSALLEVGGLNEVE